MKRKLLQLFIALSLFTLPALAAENERSLTDILRELCMELNMETVQRAQTQQRFSEEFDRQQKQMTDVVKRANEISILLYSQEQKKTFDMAFTLNKVTSGYVNFNQGKRPYDQIISGLDFEIERYARLVESLRRLPPEMKEMEIEKVLPDSLTYQNDTLKTFLLNTPSILEKEIITYKDTASAPFVLDERGEQFRDSCILYASELLKMYAGNRDSVIVDSVHYQEVYLRTKETYDYAESQYTELGKYVFSEGQIPYPKILANFDYYWNDMIRTLNSEYDFQTLNKIKRVIDERRKAAAAAGEPRQKKGFADKLFGKVQKAFIVRVSVFQLCALLILWILLFCILWLLCRFTRLSNYIPKMSLPVVTILIGTVLYLLLFGYVSPRSDYIRSGVNNINTFLWMLIAISASLLLRVKPDKIRNGIRLYLPTFLLSLVIIFCRNTYVPDILMNVIFTPVLFVAALGQLLACLIEKRKATQADIMLGWISLAVYVIALLISFSGSVFAALIDLVWWYFMLTAILAILCVSDLLTRYKDKRLEPRMAALRKCITYVSGDDREIMLFSVTWFHDLIRQVALPSAVLLSLPWCVRQSLNIFNFSEIFTRFYYKPFFQLTDAATSVSTLCISPANIVNLIILFFVLRYLNRVIHVIWHYGKYQSFMRKNKRSAVRTNEINLSLGNSIISVVVWMIYSIVVIVTLRIPTGSLGLIAGGLSAGIGIALKDIINNFIYGIQLMGGRLRVGDWIECDGIRGRVSAINYQCVQMETVDGTEMSFLNTSLFGKNFNNLTRNNSYEFTKIIVGVAYGTDVQKVRDVLVEALQPLRTKDKYGREIVDPKKGIYVVVSNMSDSSVDIAVKQYVLVAERIGYVDRAKEIIYNSLNAAGISIPFPQCDVHLIHE